MVVVLPSFTTSSVSTSPAASFGKGRGISPVRVPFSGDFRTARVTTSRPTNTAPASRVLRFIVVLVQWMEGRRIPLELLARARGPANAPAENAERAERERQAEPVAVADGLGGAGRRRHGEGARGHDLQAQRCERLVLDGPGDGLVEQLRSGPVEVEH